MTETRIAEKDLLSAITYAEEIGKDGTTIRDLHVATLLQGMSYEIRRLHRHSAALRIALGLTPEGVQRMAVTSDPPDAGATTSVLNQLARRLLLDDTTLEMAVDYLLGSPEERDGFLREVGIDPCALRMDV